MKNIFQELYEEYHQDLFQFIFYMVKDQATTEDLVQEVYIKVLKSYDSFAGKSSQKTWLFSIARHITIDYFRKQGTRKKHTAERYEFEEYGQYIQDQSPIPEEVAVKNESVQQMYRCLDLCSENHKLVIVLRYIQEMSIKETANVLGWSESKVKTTQHRALKHLRDIMEQAKEGVEDE
ncbi:RNA polymerase sigma factor SigX [Alkalibacillus aidingensis]|uniref:RNA polymerase sigma factor SigX n=1 Tax=Alkalibacillus aidingensis TaxID=2747607 RepID=UPI001661405C|nr:RNA polymerase sigma factor SigX [Alkalibacillus aidingensis]